MQPGLWVYDWVENLGIIFALDMVVLETFDGGYCRRKIIRVTLPDRYIGEGNDVAIAILDTLARRIHPRAGYIYQYVDKAEDFDLQSALNYREIQGPDWMGPCLGCWSSDCDYDCDWSIGQGPQVFDCNGNRL